MEISPNLKDRNLDVSKWFDNFVASLRAEELQLVSGIANQEKKEFWKSVLENNNLELAYKSREMSSMMIIPDLLSHYILGLKKRNVALNSISLQLSDSKILVWAVVPNDDENAMNQLFLEEAVINAKYCDSGFHISTTIMEESDNCETPSQFQPLK